MRRARSEDRTSRTYLARAGLLHGGHQRRNLGAGHEYSLGGGVREDEVDGGGAQGVVQRHTRQGLGVAGLHGHHPLAAVDTVHGNAVASAEPFLQCVRACVRAHAHVRVCISERIQQVNAGLVQLWATQSRA